MTFPGLAHRMEEVGRLGAVRFINDSKATNADAARQALSSYDRVFWIAGGRAKDGGIEDLTDLFPRVAHAYLIGEAAEPFARTLSARPHTICHDMATAVAKAAADSAGLPLFQSAWKYDSRTGWPSFYRAIEGSVGTKTDYLIGFPRTEYHCARCLGHQGHIFDDGPRPTGKRYCNNGVALTFKAA